MGDLSPHFSLVEFACRCGCGYGLESSHVNQDLIDLLEAIRKMVARPVYVTSGCRCLLHNQTVDGDTHSAHLRGNAADVRIYPWSGHARFMLVSAAVLCHASGIGVAGSFIHVDVDTVLPRPSLWSY